jgi:hypothetical protein
MGSGDRVWASDRLETKQKNGKVSSKYSSVSFDDAGNYLKSEDDNGKVSTDFKKLGVPIQSGKEMQSEYDEEHGKKKGGSISLKDCKVNTAETRNSKHKSW